MADNLDDRVDKLENRMESTEGLLRQGAIITLEVAQAQKENEKLIRELREAQKHPDERVNILVGVMDQWIRANPCPGPSPA